MALDARIRELDSRHRDLDAAIRSELTHPSVDDLQLTLMKKRKLRLKEELDVLRQRGM
jgi:hypothetical protein